MLNGLYHGLEFFRHMLMRNPSPPFRGERKGPTPQAWEGEVGGGDPREIPTSPRPSPPPRGGEGDEMPFPLPLQIATKCACPSAQAGVQGHRLCACPGCPL